MSTTSQWPLTPDAVRHITPEFMLLHLQGNPLTRACYPTAFGYYPAALGHHMERPSHQDNLLIYCADGQGKIETDHYRGTAQQGDVILLPASCAHRYRALDDNPWTIYWVHFDGLQTAQLIRELDFNPVHIIKRVGQLPTLESDFKRLLGLRQSGYRSNTFNYAAALIRQMLYYLAMQIRSSQSRQLHNFNLDQLQSLMLENIDGELDLDTLAASTQLSRHHFASKYKKIAGISPIKHFIHLKMERACYLLDTSHASVKSVAGQLGYSDPLYFSRLFKKVMGMSPSEYRRRLKV